MTPAKMFDGDLWMLASDAVKMAENAYKKGQVDERKAIAKFCEDHLREGWTDEQIVEAIRERGQT